MASSSSIRPLVPGYSRSTIKARPESRSFLFKIYNYSRKKLEVPNGRMVTSRPFLLGDRIWHLEFYPNGATRKVRDYTSLYLRLENAPPGLMVLARVVVSLLDKDDNPVPPYIYTSIVHGFCEGKSAIKFFKFVMQYDLELRLIEDSFSMKVDVFLQGEARTTYTTPESLSPEVVADFENLLASANETFDVQFLVGGQTIPAHKAFLIARSKVFKALLCGKMKEASTREPICIEEMDPVVFEALLRYIYTDVTPDIDQEDGLAMYQHLLVAADRYDLETLKLICEHKLCSQVNINTVATMLALADQRNCERLKAECILFLSPPDTLGEVMQQEDFKILTEEDGLAMYQLLLVAADRYGLETLKLICEGKLCSQVNINTVATMLALADQRNCKRLKAECILFLSLPDTLEEVMQQEDFKILTDSCPGILDEIL